MLSGHFSTIVCNFVAGYVPAYKRCKADRSVTRTASRP
jgi:hypothetical protein